MEERGEKSKKRKKKGTIDRKNRRKKQENQKKIERKSKEKEAEKIDDARLIWYNVPKIIITYNIAVKE